jgi:hypothetical protein
MSMLFSLLFHHADDASGIAVIIAKWMANPFKLGFVSSKGH